jgi:putative ABC transport system permease protein
MNFVMDLGFAVRALRKNAAFTAACLTTLGVGIGITAAVFTVVNGVLLRPLPYTDPSRIETIWLTSSRAALGNEIPLSIGLFSDLRSSQKSFSSVAGVQSWTPSLADGGTSELVSAARVTPSVFTVLGIHPALGRGFTDADGEPGAAHVALIGDALWRRRFSRSPSVIGRRVDLGSSSYVIVGVMPAGFSFPRGGELPPALQFAPRTELWAPLAFTEADRQEYRVLSMTAVGRLAPGVSVSQAKADLGSVMAASVAVHPRKNPLAYDLTDMQTQAGRHVRGTLLFLMAAVSFVLFIACANVTNLLIARTATRRREFAVRAALGAGRGRIARQLITENLLLGTIGTALGLLVSVAVTHAMLALVPGSMPRVDDVAVDWRVAVGAGLTAIVVGSVLGAVSALQVRVGTLAATLRDAGARSTAGRGTGIRRNALVIAEISLAVMLVIGALLLTTSFVRLEHVEPGFEPKSTLVAGVVLPIPPAEDRDGKRFGNPHFAQVYAQLVERVSKSPGVTAVAASSMVPLSSTAGVSNVRVANEPMPEAGKMPLAEFGRSR